MPTLIDPGHWSGNLLLAGKTRRVTMPCSVAELQSIAQDWGVPVEQVVMTSSARIGGRDVAIVRAAVDVDRHGLGIAPAREFTDGVGDDCALCGFELAQHHLGVTCPTS